jgi:hypothetical protein
VGRKSLQPAGLTRGAAHSDDAQAADYAALIRPAPAGPSILEASVFLNHERTVAALATRVGIVIPLPSGSDRLNKFVCIESVSLIDHAVMTFKRTHVFWTGSGRYIGGFNFGAVEVAVLLVITLLAHNNFIRARC